MTGLAITGWGIVCGAGVGKPAFAGAMERGGTTPTGVEADGPAYVVPDLDARRLLGKGTNFYSRATTLGMVAGREALEESGLDVVERGRRIGVAVGTTTGSLKSTSDCTRDSATAPKPYMVNPGTFPNVVMNSVAGEIAIRFGLRGVNCTVAGGWLAGLGALRYGQRMLDAGKAEAMLCLAVEEMTPDAAWLFRLAEATPEAAFGEGAAAFVVEKAAQARAEGRRVHAELLGLRTAFRPDGAIAAGLADCATAALRDAGLGPADVALVAASDRRADGRRIVDDALRRVCGHAEQPRLCVEPVTGECHAAAGAMQLAGLLHGLAAGGSRVALLPGWTREGAVGVALVQGDSA